MCTQRETGCAQHPRIPTGAAALANHPACPLKVRPMQPGQRRVASIEGACVSKFFRGHPSRGLCTPSGTAAVAAWRPITHSEESLPYGYPHFRLFLSYTTASAPDTAVPCGQPDPRACPADVSSSKETTTCTADSPWNSQFKAAQALPAGPHRRRSQGRLGRIPLHSRSRMRLRLPDGTAGMTDPLQAIFTPASQALARTTPPAVSASALSPHQERFRHE
jgi:hypothetical protein